MTLPRNNLANVTLFDRPAGRLVQQDIAIPTGFVGWEQRVTLACHEKAFDYGYTHWAQPATIAGGATEWRVYECVSSRVRQFLRRFPSREAAEMWVLHHGD